MIVLSSEVTMSQADPIARFKNAYTSSSKYIHINNAGVAPICRPALESVQYWSQRLHEEGTFAIGEILAAQQKTRESLAKLINAPSSQIAFFQGAANAISQFAFGFELKAGDEIILWDQEYPSNFYPWRDAATRAGARVVVAESGPNLSTSNERLIKLITPRTRLIVFSWVQYQTGAIVDFEPIVAEAKKRGIITFADVIQGVGLLPFDFAQSGLDAVIGGSHKWMTSPMGVGYLATKQEIFESLRPMAVGAMTYGSTDDAPSMTVQPQSGPARFEPGSRPLLELAAFGKAVDLFLETGMATIAQEAEWLAKRLLQGLRERGYTLQSPHGAHHRGAIVNFKPSELAKYKTPPEVEDALKQNGVSFAGKRAGGIRLSPHAFNTSEAIDKVLNFL